MRTSEADQQHGPLEAGTNPVAHDYLQQRRKLMKYCSYVIGDSAASEEIVQECFLRLIQTSHESGSPDSITDWLFICARNLCFRHLRSQKVRAAYRPLLERVDANISAEDRWFIQEVLGRLTAEERDLILLREMEQYSIAEIAYLIGISEDAVRVRLHRIRKKMQELGRS